MIGALRALGSAFAYFTIFPAGKLARGGPPDAQAVSYLPFVGAVVGAIAGLAGYAAFAWLHVSWAFAVAWAAGIGLTGAVHVDGLLDACDGLFATATPQRRLEILKDVHHGTFAIAGMAVAAAFGLAALAAIAPQRYPIVLAFSAAAARLAVLPNAWFFPYARSGGGGMAASFAARPNAAVLAVAFVLVEALAWRVTPWALAIAPAAAIVAWAGARWASRRLGGGVTGDVYGALVVVVEILVLLAVGVIAAR